MQDVNPLKIQEGTDPENARADLQHSSAGDAAPPSPTHQLSNLSIKQQSSRSQAELFQEPTATDTTRLPALNTIHHQHSTSGGGYPTPHASVPSSPTAASEYSVTTTHASTSSTVPFSHIARQRKQQEREEALQEASRTLLHDAAAAFDLRMASYTQDIATLEELNQAAAQQYSGTAEIAAALGQFVSDLQARQAAAQEALRVLPELDRQLEVLATAVSQLDKHSRQLEAKLGLKPLSGSGGHSGSSSAYGYLASSVSQLTAAGVSTAAAGLGCLSGNITGTDP